jgi:hypothetical protein
MLVEPDMKATVLASILAIGAASLPQIAAAGSYTRDDAHLIERISYSRPMAPSRAALPLWRMDLTPRKPLERPYAQLSKTPAEDRVPTAVSYRLSPDGPVGSVGFVRLGASHALDPSAMSNGVANQPGAPDQTVGAALAYDFR